VIGVDASHEMLDVARRRVHDARLANVDLRLGALEHLPLSDGEANAMIANLVLHHVANVAPVLREIHRGLAPGGRVVIVELTDDADESFWSALGAQWPGFDPDDLAAELANAGFGTTSVERLGPIGTNGSGPAPERAGRPHLFLLEAVSLTGPPRRGRTTHREGDRS
jgi:ArsR family transcriptional regulator